MLTQFIELFFWILLVVGGTALYMLPTIVAIRANHPRVGAVTFLNITLAWTVLAWLPLLLWAMNTESMAALITSGQQPSVHGGKARL